MTSPLSVLFEDNHCLAVAKPAPLLTQAPDGIPSLEAQAKAYLKDRYHKAGKVYLGVPHRLDRPVSGVVLFARSTKAAHRLAEQFQDRSVIKVYWAAVEGCVQPAEGAWEDWLRKVQDEPRAEPVHRDEPGAQQALLSYSVLGRSDGETLLELRPRTGRMHQIRLQTSLRGWPVRGDTLYGAKQPFGLPAAHPRDAVIALHGRSLTFRHPIRYEAMTVTAPLPATWADLVCD